MVDKVGYESCQFPLFRFSILFVRFLKSSFFTVAITRDVDPAVDLKIWDITDFVQKHNSNNSCSVRTVSYGPWFFPARLGHKIKNGEKILGPVTYCMRSRRK